MELVAAIVGIGHCIGPGKIDVDWLVWASFDDLDMERS